MTKKELYHKRKSKGVCVNCGGEIEKERKGKTMCRKCADEKNKSQRLDRATYIKHGICPICKTNRLVGDEHRCYECSVRENQRVKGYRDKEKEIDPVGYSKRNSEASRRTRWKYVSQGLCVRCGRKKSAQFTLCARCRERQKEYDIRYKERKEN